MRDYFVIEGGHPLRGEVTPGGNKNAALPAMAAALLTDEPVVLHNLPAIKDVATMGKLLAALGVLVEQRSPHTWVLQAKEVEPPDPYLGTTLFRAIRGSILITGPLLGRCGRLRIPAPGGDVIGRRRVDTHFLAFRKLGAEVEVRDGMFDVRTAGLQGADFLLDEASVTGTENAVMAAVLARGTTIISNAASEPHVQDLCHLLNQMGAQISGIGSNTLTIQGVDKLHGTEFTIGTDYIEVGSYIALATDANSEILIRQATPQHLRMILPTMERLGVQTEVRGDAIFVGAEQPMRIIPDMNNAIPSIADAPWPAFPADLMSISLVLATQSEGVVIFHEKMFESRLFFVDKLIDMGAQIILCDPHRAAVIGLNQQTRLRGITMTSPDIRAGVALLIAALSADGISTINNIEQIDRGYQNIDTRLRALGANITRKN